MYRLQLRNLQLCAQMFPIEEVCDVMCCIYKKQNGNGLCKGSTMCECGRRNGALFARSWAETRLCALVSDTFDVLI